MGYAPAVDTRPFPLIENFTDEEMGLAAQPAIEKTPPGDEPPTRNDGDSKSWTVQYLTFRGSQDLMVLFTQWLEGSLEQVEAHALAFAVGRRPIVRAEIHEGAPKGSPVRVWDCRTLAAQREWYRRQES
jgi:hypothetical protein